MNLGKLFKTDKKSPSKYAKQANKLIEARAIDIGLYKEQAKLSFKSDSSIAEHYFENWSNTNYKPNRWFDKGYYLSQNPDVREVGVNPLYHYVMSGWKEKRRPNGWLDFYQYNEILNENETIQDVSHSLSKLALEYDNSLNMESNGYLSTFTSNHVHEAGEISDMMQLCHSIGFDYKELPKVDIDYFNQHSGLLKKTEVQAIKELLQLNTIQLLEFSSDKKQNAEFYLILSRHYIINGQRDKAITLLKYSINLYRLAEAFELLGNSYLDQSHFKHAVLNYEQALSLNDNPGKWLFMNTFKCYFEQQEYESAIELMFNALKVYPLNHEFLKRLDEVIEKSWEKEQQDLHILSHTNNRVVMLEKVWSIVSKYSNCYKKAYTLETNSKINLQKDISLNNRNVLIIGDYHIPQCIRYRIDQKVEQLESQGYKVKTRNWVELNFTDSGYVYADIIIIYRSPAIPKVIKTIELAKMLNKVVIYEIDDLIFTEKYPEDYSTYGGSISIDEYNGLVFGMPLFNAAAKLCDYSLSSTRSMHNNLVKLVHKQQGIIHRNGLDKQNTFNEEYVKKHDIVVFYGSGTLAHNADFNTLVVPALEKVMEANPNVKLMIVGHLNLPDSFINTFKNQIIIKQKTSTLTEYWKLLSKADINLAVLMPNVITDCKSELKWFEAGCLTTPSIVSDTQNYIDVIEDGVDGFIASTTEDWEHYLSILVDDFELRKSVGQTAFNKIKSEYNVSTLGRLLNSELDKLVEMHTGATYE